MGPRSWRLPPLPEVDPDTQQIEADMCWADVPDSSDSETQQVCRFPVMLSWIIHLLFQLLFLQEGDWQDRTEFWTWSCCRLAMWSPMLCFMKLHSDITPPVGCTVTTLMTPLTFIRHVMSIQASELHATRHNKTPCFMFSFHHYLLLYHESNVFPLSSIRHTHTFFTC